MRSIVEGASCRCGVVGSKLMKAVIARDFAPIDQLDYADWPEPQATGDTVVIQSEAIGVNFPDGLLVQGLYQAKPPLPFVPGMEAAGRVVAVGPEVKRLKVGDRALAMLTHGGYAEKVGAPERLMMKLPDGMPAAEACALFGGYGTALHALRQRAELKSGETLCVLGASGLTGLSAVQIGKALGARVVAVASSEAKQAICREAGADIVIGYDGLKDRLKELTGGKGVDVGFDPVGGDMFDALARSMAWRGRLLVIGFASGEIPKFPVNLALVKGFSVVGVFMGGFVEREPKLHSENLDQLVDWYFSGAIKPLIEGVFPLAEAADVLQRVHTRGVSGKLILQP